MKKHDFDRSQAISLVEFVNGFLDDCKGLGEEEFQKTARALYDKAKGTQIGSAKQQEELSELKGRPDMVDYIFAALDDNNDKLVSYKELTDQLDPNRSMAVLDYKTGTFTMKYWDDAFRSYDSDKDGFISRDEFKKCLLAKHREDSDRHFLLIMADMLKKAQTIFVAGGGAAKRNVHTDAKRAVADLKEEGKEATASLDDRSDNNGLTDAAGEDGEAKLSGGAS